MKLIFLSIYMLLFIGYLPTFGQSFVNQGIYWPYYAPNGTARPISDSTAEDWWYDVKTVPSTHPDFNGGGRYIGCGYSSFDDIGLGKIYSNDPCSVWQEVDFNASFDASDFELPDMRHLNTSGTIGLVDLTRTSSLNNPYVWIYHYGLGVLLIKVIPTSDGGFLATGATPDFNMPYPSSEPQFANFQTGGNSAILYQSPSATIGFPNESNPFSFKDCPPDYNKPEEPSRSFKKWHACLIKVDSDGVIQWYYTYGIVPFTDDGLPAYKNSSAGTDLAETTDGYILAGILHDSPVYGDLGNHGFLLKVDAYGVLQWIKDYSDHDFLTQKFTAIQLTKDLSAIYVTGERTAGNAGIFSGYPNSSAYLNGSDYADREHYFTMKFLPFLKKMDPSDGTELWDLPLEGDPDLDYRVRNVAVDKDGNVLVPVSSACNVNFASGECKNNYVDKVVDYGSSGSVIQQTEFGPMRAYDMATGLGVTATTDGGFLVMGTKKAYDLSINKDYSLFPLPGGYDMTGLAQEFTQTDAFVAKCNSTGDIEWTSIFDNVAPSPGGDILTNAGNPRNETNLDSWMNHTADRSKADIKRQECIYSVSTSSDGEVIVGGNMSTDLDDSYIAMVDNTCDLTLSNTLIQSLLSHEVHGDTPQPLTQMNNFIASNISTGRTPGNTNDVAVFDVNHDAVIQMVAGQDITMYEGSDLERGTKVDASINPSHTCSSGPIYSYSNNYANKANAEVTAKKNLLQTLNAAGGITVMPNPTSGQVMVRHPKDIKQLEVFDLYGKSVVKIINHGSTQTRINLSNVSSGLYMLRIEGVNSVIKIVKQ